MTPQSSFMVLVPLARNRVAEMRDLLSEMNLQPGVVNPQNALVPFAALSNLHFARFVILDDPTTGDVALYRMKRPEPPIYLAFLGDFDGDYGMFIDHLCARAGNGLRRIFALCDGFTASTDLALWMRAHECRPATYYCNWVGRTVKQCREEEQLRLALREYLSRSPQLARADPKALHAELRRFVRREQAVGGITLTPSQPTPILWQLRHALYAVELVALILGGIITLPLTVIPLIIIALRLRKLEVTDPEFAPRPKPEWIEGLAALEDYGITNQFSAMGSLKPGILRRFLLKLILWIVNLTTQVIYTKGRLARVSTIHFARWVALDSNTRLFFASNYDGSLDSYMDDFINKVAFGLNAVFSNGIGYPRTEWLLLKGAKNEQPFKYYLRRHELPTEVWYNAHDGHTTFDLERNGRIRRGIESSSMPARELAEWVALL